MSRNCSRCGNEIVELILSDKQAIEIWGLQVQDLKLSIVKKLKDDFGYTHRESKIIMDHLNPKKGKCRRCDYENLQGENVDCPKCKAFNYNMDFQPPFNQDFCTHLAGCLDFEHLKRDDLKGYWCDGINHLPYDIKSLAKSRVEKDRQIKTKAWIGKDGQGEYDMILNLGNEFVKAYSSDQNLIDSIPDKKEKDWVAIDTDRKTIEIKLK